MKKNNSERMFYADCRNAKTITHLDGINDNRILCSGLYVESTCWEIEDKCMKCPIFVLNVEILRGGAR